jgi:hypothetical protein
MLIRLDDHEMRIAEIIGKKRHEESANRKTTRGQPVETSWDSHMVGAYGEMAVGKALNLYPGFTVNNFNGPDIEPNIQVRAARKGRLILTDKDNSFHKYVLVLGEAPDLDVVGWLWGYEGQDAKWLFDPNNNRPPAYFVPKEALRPIETLNAN